jgi:hypothetical protein
MVNPSKTFFSPIAEKKFTQRIHHFNEKNALRFLKRTKVLENLDFKGCLKRRTAASLCGFLLLALNQSTVTQFKATLCQTTIRRHFYPLSPMADKR